MSEQKKIGKPPAPKVLEYLHNPDYSTRLAYKPDWETGCWNWLGRVSVFGYGQKPTRQGTKMAHRVFYEALIGPIPPGLQIDHLCKNKRCVNPQHLEPVTARENTMRSSNPAATNSRKTHCPKGHSHWGVRPVGGRWCLDCRMDRYWRNKKLGRRN